EISEVQVVDPADEGIAGAAPDRLPAAFAKLKGFRLRHQGRRRRRRSAGFLGERVLDQRRVVVDDFLEWQRESEIYAGNGPHEDQRKGPEADGAVQIPVETLP